MHFLVDLNQIHSLRHGAGNVDPAQPCHGVQVHKVVVRLRIPDTLEPGLAPGELRAVVGGVTRPWSPATYLSTYFLQVKE